MALWTREKRDFFDALADEFLRSYSLGRTFVAIDGADGAGTATFADALAERMARNGHAVFRASVDRFQRPREERHARGADSAEGRYRDSFDYDLFRRVLIEPFRLGGSTGFVAAAFDAERDVPIEMEWRTGPQDATLIVDGDFLIRPELRGIWNYSIWLDSDAAEARGAAHTLYLTDAKPRERVSAIVDTTDPELPRRVFADSC